MEKGRDNVSALLEQILLELIESTIYSFSLAISLSIFTECRAEGHLGIG